MIRIPFWYPQREYFHIGGEINLAIQGVMQRSQLVGGLELDFFEKRFAELVGTKHAVGVGSGTDALILALRALGIHDGEVITSSHTFRATVDAIQHVGATPILADIGEDWKMYRTDKTRAVIPVHIAGDVQDWQPDEAIPMIEDACQAVGAAPIRGVIACYSFYPAKILGCYGQGGAIATNDPAISEKIRYMCNLFKGRGESLGYNSRLDNLQAAILNVKLDYHENSIRRRKDIAMKYDAALKEMVKIPRVRAIYQDYIIGTQFAGALVDFLANLGIEAMRNEYRFPDAIPKRQRAVDYERETLRLPCHPYLTDDEVNEVIHGVMDFFLQVKYD